MSPKSQTQKSSTARHYFTVTSLALQASLAATDSQTICFTVLHWFSLMQTLLPYL